MMVSLPSVDDHAGSTEAQVLSKHLHILMDRVRNALRIAAHSPKVAQSPEVMIAPQRKEGSGVLDVRHMNNNIRESRVSRPEDSMVFMRDCWWGERARPDLRGAGSAP